MSRRTLATSVVVTLLLALVTAMVALPVPYVAMSPGPTVDVLATSGGKPIIDVAGHPSYPTRGDLRLTTVSVTNPTRSLRLPEVLVAWFDKERAVYPRDIIYPPDQSAEDVEQQSNVEMVSSQDLAVAAALTELGYHLPVQVEVLAVTKGSPAAGRLEVRDRIIAVEGTRITRAEQVSKALQAIGVDKTARLLVRRDGKDRTVTVRTRAADDDPQRAVVGVQIGVGYDFPFEVSVRLQDDIGGPSAGLIFALGVYDTLTPGALSGGSDIAGTGTITEAGRVGPIGGIQQKIVAAEQAGAKVFLVPPDNCDSAVQAPVGRDTIRLVKAPTLHSAVRSLQTYADDPSADLPSCR
ncbi:MAG: S16 family serine protease [Nocardioidaceae bacterium]